MINVINKPQSFFYKHIKFTTHNISMLLLAFAVNCLVYRGGRYIAQNSYHINMTTEIDRAIPFLPWMMIFYWGCYLFWGVNYTLIICSEYTENKRFVAAHIIGEFVCLLAFVFLPTTMVRAQVTDHTIMERLVKILYSLDSADNLFPSLHCYLSWLCWIGVRRNPGISKGYRWFSFILAAAVCFSTLTVKQHVLADVFAGIMLAEGSYSIAGELFSGAVSSDAKLVPLGTMDTAHCHGHCPLPRV